MKKDWSYIYLVGFEEGGHFEIRYVADTEEKAQAKIKQYIKQIKKDAKISEKEKQKLLDMICIRKYCINDDYCTYGIRHF